MSLVDVVVSFVVGGCSGVCRCLRLVLVLFVVVVVGCCWWLPLCVAGCCDVLLLCVVDCGWCCYVVCSVMLFVAGVVVCRCRVCLLVMVVLVVRCW